MPAASDTDRIRDVIHHDASIVAVRGCSRGTKYEIDNLVGAVACDQHFELDFRYIGLVVGAAIEDAMFARTAVFEDLRNGDILNAGVPKRSRHIVQFPWADHRIDFDQHGPPDTEPYQKRHKGG